MPIPRRRGTVPTTRVRSTSLPFSPHRRRLMPSVMVASPNSLPCGRELQPKGRAQAFMTGDGDHAAVLLHDRLGDVEPQSGALAWLLGGEKGGEDLVEDVRADSPPGVRGRGIGRGKDRTPLTLSTPI